jgi:hypothetical protein
MSKKETKETINTKEINLEEEIINGNYKKYEKLVLAMRWVYHLKELQEYKDKPTAQLIDEALKDVLSGKITLEDVEKAEIKDEEARIKKAEEKRKEKIAKKEKEKDKK